MGECGCIGCGERYKMRGPGLTWYIVKLLPKCDYCCVGPTVMIEQIGPTDYRAEMLAELEEMPQTYECDGAPTWCIKAGVSDDELKAAARKNAFDGIDEVSAECLADGMLDELRSVPELVPAT